jgi:hypothetical protein
MGLGSALRGDGVTLDQAREKAKAARAQLRDGTDPLEAGRAGEGGSSGAQADHVPRSSGGVSPKPRTGLAQSQARAAGDAEVEDLCLPDDRQFAGGRRRHAARAQGSDADLERQNRNREPGARSNRIDIGVGDRHGYRSGDNPARWRGHLEFSLAKRSVVAKTEHFASLPYQQMPTFMAELRQREGISARALAFVIELVCRTGEALGAVWDEFDLDQKVWIVPAHR